VSRPTEGWPSRLKVAIVDDEGPARSELRHLLAAHDVEVVAEAAGAAEAVRVLEAAPLDAVFLDVEMPGLTGLQLARAVAQSSRAPAIVFVTAHAGYVVDAFAVEAFDYLLKPVDPERLARVVERLASRDARPAAAPGRIAVVAGGGGTELLDVELVHYVQADGDYSRVHTFDRSYLCTSSLRDLEETLPEDRFVRVHRSHVVNLAKVAAVRRAGPDRIRLALDDAAKTELDVARRQARRVRELLRL
jgi:two-component system, LytTR family, response regulator